ncbi:MAG: hypothetical protein JWO87_1342 [Phycisphaerales bacterium]|nr:hypothetical protein [Phycisphaerales bacterium]
MIHPALYKLIALQGRGLVRRTLRGAGTPRRIVFFAVGAAVFLLWLGPAVLMATKPRSALQQEKTINYVRTIMPMVLLGVCIVTAVTSAGDKAIAFTPGEVDQLFPGPFTRRELLAYKLIKSTLAAVLTGLILSLVMLQRAQWWPACFVGVFLSLLFVQWFSIAMVLGGQALGAAAYARFRRLLMVVAGILVVVGLRTWMTEGYSHRQAALERFRDSPVVGTILKPLEPYAQAMTAAGASALVKWSAYAVLLNTGLLVLVFLLDSYYVEAAMAASERRYAKIQRIRAGSFLSLGVSKTATWRLPALPWFGGAGPIVWRQLTSAGRSARGLLLLLLIIAIGAGPILAGGGGLFHQRDSAEYEAETLKVLGIVLAWLTFLCSSMLNFDFRGDVDLIDTLKSLPLRENAVAVGQLIVPVLLLTIVHALLLGIASALLPGQRPVLLAALLLALPFNGILFASENLIFLLFPSRPAAVSPGDFQVMGRKFVFLLMKAMMLAVAGIIALFAGLLVWIMTGRALAPAIAAGWLALAAEAAALVPAIAWAYRRFDPSIHTPA